MAVKFLRSWIHYLKAQIDPSTQKEHRLIAQQVFDVLSEAYPKTMSAVFEVVK